MANSWSMTWSSSTRAWNWIAHWTTKKAGKLKLLAHETRWHILETKRLHLEIVNTSSLLVICRVLCSGLDSIYTYKNCWREFVLNHTSLNQNREINSSALASCSSCKYWTASHMAGSHYWQTFSQGSSPWRLEPPGWHQNRFYNLVGNGHLLQMTTYYHQHYYIIINSPLFIAYHPERNFWPSMVIAYKV